MKLMAGLLLAIMVWGVASYLHSTPSDGSDPMPICRKNVRSCM